MRWGKEGGRGGEEEKGGKEGEDRALYEGSIPTVVIFFILFYDFFLLKTKKML